MKRFGTILCFALLLCMLPVLGSAMDAEEWNLTCLYSSTGSTVYDLSIKEVEDGGVATTTDLTYIFTPVGSVGAGAAVKPTGEKSGGKVEIAYWSGSVRYGYVDAGSYHSDSISITANGKTYAIPKRATSSEAMMSKSIALRYSGADVEAVLDAYYRGDQGSDDDASDESGEGSGNGSSSTKKTASDRMNPVFRLVGEDGSEQVVSLVTLGLVDSEVKLNGEVITVKTSDLTWDHDVDDENKLLAVIDAKRTGEATMHAKAKAKSDVLKKCDTNRVVVVLRLGKGYTRILYDGVEGFVLTDALTFYPVGGVKEKDEAPVPGWVSYKGNVKSRQKINIRQSGKNGSRIVDEFKAGTPVWVFGIDGKWAEVEVGGYRAFILKEHITLDESYKLDTTAE